jgi:hypothetical protein
MQVSLFLQEGIQDVLAHFYLQSPKGTDASSVGTITQFSSGDSVLETTMVVLEFMQESANEWFCHPCQLGTNLYACASLTTAVNNTAATAVCSIVLR